MTLSEFKAWFEGFTENIDGQPNKKQWQRIKIRVGEISSEPTPYPFYIERYVRPYREWWPPPISWTTNNTTPMTTSAKTVPFNHVLPADVNFMDTGRAEWKQIAAKGSAG